MNDKRSLAQKFEEKITQNGQNLTFENNLGAPIQVQPVMQVEVPAGDPRVIKTRHEQSVKTYPDITVDEDEYVVLSMRRHSLGYLLNIIFSAFIGVLLISAWIIICFMPNPLTIPANFKPQISLIFGSIKCNLTTSITLIIKERIMLCFSCLRKFLYTYQTPLST